MFREIEGDRRLELKYMYFAASFNNFLNNQVKLAKARGRGGQNHFQGGA